MIRYKFRCKKCGAQAVYIGKGYSQEHAYCGCGDNIYLPENVISYVTVYPQCEIIPAPINSQLTQRDYFIGQALSGLLPSYKPHMGDSEDRLISNSINIADALIKTLEEEVRK